MTVPPKICQLVDAFRTELKVFHSGNYNETQTRREFIDPFFRELGWDMENASEALQANKEVVHEARVLTVEGLKAPDYAFYLGGERKFFVEAKKPSVNLEDDNKPAYQLRRYAWSASLPVSILTDFEELAIYDCRIEPRKEDRASVARISYFKFSEYEQRWDEIVSLFSKAAVREGSLEKYTESLKTYKGIATVDAAFLKEISSWRELLAQNIAHRNPTITQYELNFSVQMLINRIIFLRIAEDRGIEPYERLADTIKADDSYKALCNVFVDADDRYNAGLFHFREEKGRREMPDDLTLHIQIDNEPLRHIISHLYYPESPYAFGVMPVEILGSVYEQFLGKVLVLRPSEIGGALEAIVEEKPEVRKAGGVYYTPRYIVDYIVSETVGKRLEGKTPKQASELRILDPACGSGGFLIGAYQYLLDWHLQWYLDHGGQKRHKKELMQDMHGLWRLSTSERKRILLNNIYGVDIDVQAVEVTKLSLSLKVLEGETDASLYTQLQMFRERALPDLGSNIKSGNSLIGPDFFQQVRFDYLNEDQTRRINIFDWQSAFPNIITVGGFDVVIGNPPYVDSEWMSVYMPEVRQYCTSHYKAGSGNWDLFCIFIEKAMELCKKGGLTSLIVPNKLGSANYATGARSVLTDDNHLLSIRDYSRVPVFPVAVYPIVYVAQRGDSRVNFVSYERMKHVVGNIVECEIENQLDYERVFGNSARPWAIFSNAYDSSLIERLTNEFPNLGSIAEVLGAATVSEAYELKNAIQEHTQNVESAFKVVNSGTIDRYVTLWGRKPLRYLGGSYLRPVIPTDKSHLLPVKRAQQASHPKIIIAGMTLVLEAMADLQGDILAAKSTTIVLSRVDLRYLLAILNSKLLNFYYRTTFGGDSLQGGYLKVGPPQIRTLPIALANNNDAHERKLYDEIVQAVEHILSLQKQSASARTSHDKAYLQQQIGTVDNQIDSLVYKIYKLTKNDIREIEGTVGRK